MSNQKQNPENMLKYPLAIGDIVNLSVEKFKDNFLILWLPFFAISLLLIVISNFLVGIFPITVDISPYFNLETGEVIEEIPTSVLLKYLEEYLRLFLSQYIVTGALMTIPVAFGVLVVTNAFYLQNKTNRELINSLVPKIPILLIVGLITSVIMILGLAFALLIGSVAFGFSGLIGAIVMLVLVVAVIVIIPVWFSIVIVLIMNEDAGFSSLGISKNLTSAFVGKVFGMLVVIGIIQFFISLVAGFVFDLFSSTLSDEIYFISLSAIESIPRPLTAISIFYIYLELKFQKSKVYSGYVSSFQQPQQPQQTQYTFQQPRLQNQNNQMPPSNGITGYQPPTSFGSQSGSGKYGESQPSLPQSKNKFCGTCGASAINAEDKFCNSCGNKYPI